MTPENILIELIKNSKNLLKSEKRRFNVSLNAGLDIPGKKTFIDYGLRNSAYKQLDQRYYESN